ncbi:glycoside hydrolase family 1 protein [Chloroflexia bacterium SDU3-3]|nr:glycoside hydrolase family 1 protein [Chloroflexia bacterium SDU3-3]
MTPLRFPPGFLWGTASSSHQHEGGNTNNQWWDWEQQPGSIWHGDRSGAACGWWEEIEPDLDRAVGLAQNALRISLEWSRIEPEEGRFDEGAIQRYRQILQAIRARGMTPMVTLHHFTNPRWIEQKGAWLHPETPYRFARFAEHALARLGDLCELWCTINEPTIYASMGYLHGHWPPGRYSVGQARRVLVAMLRGHGLAVQVIHAAGPQHRAGLVHNLHIVDPSTPNLGDLAIAKFLDVITNGAVLTAIQTGRIIPPFGHGRLVLPGLAESDFIGLNYYSRSWVAFDMRRPREFFSRSYTPDHAPQSDLNSQGRSYGEIYPDGLYRALKRLSGIGLPIYITETGLPDHDDDQRPQFILSHLAAVHRALREGADVRGVFIWSLIDNFEWSEGWELRFGLYGLDERTGERTLRPSGALYGIIARANALPAQPHQHEERKR